MRRSCTAHIRHVVILARLVGMLSVLLAMLPALCLGASRDPGQVVRVVDGDTLVIRLDSRREEHVRLIGVDTPESKRNKRAAMQAERSHSDEAGIIALGKASAKNTEKLAPPSTQVELEYDVEQRDRYKRLLAYVYLPDGRMLNEAILEGGYGSVLTVPPNVRYVARFRNAAEKARSTGQGLWRPEPAQ